MSTHSCRALTLGLALAASASWATVAPNEVVLHAGYDAKGGSWSVRAGRDERLVVVGPKRFTPALRSPLDYLALRATVDGGTLWIADASPRVVSVALADGSTKETRLPLPWISEIVARGGLLFAAYIEGGATFVLRFDPATGRSERLFEARLPGTPLAIGAGPSRLWLATWTGLGAPRVRVDLVGVPLSKASQGAPPARPVAARSGLLPAEEAPRRATREAEWAAERWAGFSVHEDDTGNVWLAHTYAGRVERLDPSGVWTSWTVAPDRLVSIVTTGALAVALVATMAPEDPLAPPGIARANSSQALVVIEPGSPGLTRTNLVTGTPVESLASAGGRVWIAQGREVRIVAGRSGIIEVK